MKGMTMKLEGKKLTIVVDDVTKTFGPSSSGKTMIVASSDGPVSVPGAEAVKVGLNVYTKPAK